MAAAEAKVKLLSQHNRFYQNYYHFFIIGLMVLILMLLTAVGVVLYQMSTRPLPVFHAEQPDKETMVLRAFEEPNLLPDTILRWSSKAATTIYTFNFANYETQLQAARPYFTSAGWRNFLNSVQGVVDTIVANKLVVNGIVSGPPVISNEGPLPGVGYSWRVQIPFLVTYQSANATTKENFYVVLTIVRVPTSVNPQGIGIDQFLMV